MIQPTKKPEHSPLWRAYPCSKDDIDWAVRDRFNTSIARNIPKARAQLIVHRVNAGSVADQMAESVIKLFDDLDKRQEGGLSSSPDKTIITMMLILARQYQAM